MARIGPFFCIDGQLILPGMDAGYLLEKLKDTAQ